MLIWWHRIASIIKFFSFWWLVARLQTLCYLGNSFQISSILARFLPRKTSSPPLNQRYSKFVCKLRTGTWSWSSFVFVFGYKLIISLFWVCLDRLNAWKVLLLVLKFSQLMPYLSACSPVHIYHLFGVTDSFSKQAQAYPYTSFSPKANHFPR